MPGISKEAYLQLGTLQDRLGVAVYFLSQVLELPCAVVNTSNEVVFQHPEGHIGNCFCSRLESITGKRHDLDHFFERCHRVSTDPGNAIYNCPHGLVNILMPVFNGDSYVAAIQIGPFCTRDAEDILMTHGVSEFDIGSPDAAFPQVVRFLRTLPKGSTDYLIALTRMVKAFLTDESLELNLQETTKPAADTSFLGKGYDTLYVIQQYVATHYTDSDITLEAVAKHAYVHPSYVSHIFSEQFHTGFRDYVNSLRIKYAKELLKSTRDPVGEICHRVGYSEHSYFNKVFKKREGMTPTEYRAKCAQHQTPKTVPANARGAA